VRSGKLWADNLQLTRKKSTERNLQNFHKFVPLQNLPQLREHRPAESMSIIAAHFATSPRKVFGTAGVWSVAARVPATTIPLWRDAADQLEGAGLCKKLIRISKC
jgi:hypothetical protein